MSVEVLVRDPKDVLGQVLRTFWKILHWTEGIKYEERTAKDGTHIVDIYTKMSPAYITLIPTITRANKQILPRRGLDSNPNQSGFFFLTTSESSKTHSTQFESIKIHIIRIRVNLNLSCMVYFKTRLDPFYSDLHQSGFVPDKLTASLLQTNQCHLDSFPSDFSPSAFVAHTS